MTALLPILVLLAFGLCAVWLSRTRALDEWLIRLVAGGAGAVLLYEAITEPSAGHIGLLFVLLAVLAIVRRGGLVRRAEP